MNSSLDIEVTVLMPVFNASLYLKDAIESILNQTYTNFEFIIINDGSTDDSLAIIESFKDSRIKIINNKINIGIIKSRNKGLQASVGKYIANMDADDISLPTRLEKQINYLEVHPEISVLATKLILINNKNEEIGIWPEDHYCSTISEITNTLPIINCIGQPTIMMRKDIVNEIGYNSKFKNNEDWGLWLHLLSLKKGIAKLPEVLLKYRQHPASTTVSANKLGVEKKLLSFKFQYLKYKISNNKFKNTDKQVLGSFIKELIKFCLMKIAPRIYLIIIKLKYMNKKNLLKQFFAVRRKINQINDPLHVIYFFPSFHTGGADRVHASILEAANQNKSITFITSKSDNNAFYDKFSQYSTVIEVDELLKFGITKRWLLKKINSFCNQSKTIKVFGCNSAFFYDAIPYLPKHTVIIDLLHAFVHKYEDGPEKWSLPYIQKINSRIVINKKTKKDFDNFYAENNISLNYLSKIHLIENFVEPQEFLKEKEFDVLRIGYVGRGSEEKRVNLIAQLAKNVIGKNKFIEFHFVGNIKSSIPKDLHSACIFHNEVSDDKQLQNLYKQFHIIIIASTREGFPMVIMEAMMQGVVPISTNVGGISEHVINDVNGLLINSTSENDILKEFETKINYLFENKQELYKMAVNAHQYALKNFSKDSFFKAYSNLLSNNAPNLN